MPGIRRPASTPVGDPAPLRQIAKCWSPRISRRSSPTAASPLAEPTSHCWSAGRTPTGAGHRPGGRMNFPDQPLPFRHAGRRRGRRDLGARRRQFVGTLPAWRHPGAQYHHAAQWGEVISIDSQLFVPAGNYQDKHASSNPILRSPATRPQPYRFVERSTGHDHRAPQCKPAACR